MRQSGTLPLSQFSADSGEVKHRGTSPRIYLQEGPMSYSPILIVHICAGSLALLSGTAAMSFRKGSPRHVLAGKGFFAPLLIMAPLAVYLALARHPNPNILAGLLTL